MVEYSRLPFEQEGAGRPRRTLILVSVTEVKKWSTRRVGLHHIILEGDYDWLDGVEQPRLSIGGPEWNRVMELLFRRGGPGEPHHVFRKDITPVRAFPRDGYDKIVHCEVWC